MNKTIKQIADELGVSKDKIKYRVRKLPINCQIKKDGITYLNNEGIQALKEFFEEYHPENPREFSEEFFRSNYPFFTHVESIIELLKNELKTIKEQLNRKDKQIEQLQKLLNQQQQLTLLYKNKILQIEEKSHWWNIKKKSGIVVKKKYNRVFYVDMNKQNN